MDLVDEYHVRIEGSFLVFLAGKTADDLIALLFIRMSFHETGGMDSREAVKSMDTESGIICQDRETGLGQDVECLDTGIVLEVVGYFLCFYLKA